MGRCVSDRNIIINDNIMSTNSISWGSITAGAYITGSNAADTLTFYTNAAPILTLTTTGVNLASGANFKLGNAYVSGVIAATGHVTMQDSTGTTYQVLCHT